MTASVDAQFSSGYWLSTNFFTAIERTSQYALDAALTYQSPVPGLTVTAYVKNVSNHAVYSGGNQLSLQPLLFAATINPPRTLGGRVRYSF